MNKSVIKIFIEILFRFTYYNKNLGQVLLEINLKSSARSRTRVIR